MFGASDAAAQSVSNLQLEIDGSVATDDALSEHFNFAGCVCARPVTVAFTFSDLGTSGDLWVVAGKGCVDADGELDADCEVIAERRLETLGSVVSIETSVEALLGGDCEEVDGERTVSVVADVDDQGTWTELASRAHPVDTRAPTAPTAERVVAGEGLAEVVFSIGDDPEVGVQYQVLCAVGGEPVFEGPPTAAFVSAEDTCGATGDVRAAFVCSEAQGGAASVSVQGLVDGVEYSFSVVAVDAAGNPSDLVTVGAATPSPEEDLFEAYKAAGGAADGGHCFVATAAYGDYDHPQVRTLRAFRDRVLAPNRVGRWLIEAYYASSPPIAGFIKKQDILRTATRGVLTPVVWLADRVLEVQR